MQNVKEYQHCTRKFQVRTGTWNARTLSRSGTLYNARQEMGRLKINILEINETWLTVSGIFKSERTTMIHLGGYKHDKEGMILDENTASCVIEYWYRSGIVMINKLNAQPFNKVAMQVYAPTTNYEESELKNEREKEINLKEHESDGNLFVEVGHLNAKVGDILDK